MNKNATQQMIAYPRVVGSSTVVSENEWNPDAQDGFCPACGSIGIQIHPTFENRYKNFKCSDETCLSYHEGNIYPEQTMFY